MSSAAEAELGILYINACKAVPQHQTLAEMGHKQPQTPMQTDNTTALGVITNNIQPQCTKAMDMRFHWPRCRKAQNQFQFFWRPGPTNRVDYWTKHHCAAHHIEKHPKILRAICQNTITNKNNSSVDRTVVEVSYMTSPKFVRWQSWNRISVGTVLFFGCLSFGDVCIITHHQNLKPHFLCQHQLQVMCFCYCH